ncbi:MAG: tetratricopeptide repeat protein [Saprospiraceae bacterium]|nr:tetratricopeptide repeat protein [Saprospiraceae bacterium]
MRRFISIIIIAVVGVFVAGCSTTKSKDEVKGFKKFYHNTTSKFNGYFNAEEIMRESMVQLQDMHLDNYNDLLNVYDYVEVDNPQSVASELDRAIEKVSTVAAIHDIGNYVDDCYVIIGKAQFLKQDYVGAEETFQYFEEMFDPKNPYGRVYSKSKQKDTGRRTKKDVKKARKEKEKERDEQKKERQEERKELEDERKQREKEREQKAKERKKSAKKSRNSRKKSSRGRSSSRADNVKWDEKEAQQNPTKSKEEIEADKEKAKAQAEAIEQIEKEKQALSEKKNEEEKEKEREYKSQGEGAIFKNKSAYTEGLYWLARTYISIERFASAQYVINRLDEMAGLSDDVSRKLYAAKADLYIKTKEYDKALVELDAAIDSEKDKRKKGRYAFIRGQIFEKASNSSMAFQEYQRARKLSPDYEMKFNAQLNELKLSYRIGGTTKAKAINKLEKWLSENKNVQYSDQIYFTVAQIHLDDGNTAAAIENFEKAINASGGNPLVKLEAYYKLAELLFDEELYAEAKSNYDNALKLMKITDARYKSVEKLAKNLDAIAKNINVVRLQDSLLRLSMLPEDELMALAKELLTQQEIERIESGASAKDDQRKANIITSNRQLNTGRSNFFAYNPLALNQGKTEFKRTWGDRVLEDNWRRSLRSDATLTPELDEEEEEEVKTDFTEEELLSVLKEVPRNDIQKKSANAKIQKALFELGVLFRERLRNYERSIASLERLIREYPEYDKRDEALFYLYLSYYDMDNLKKANEIKQRLVNEFPDSKFTKLATDPNYAKSLLEKQMTIEKYYSNTYKLFEEGEYNQVIENVKEKDKLFPGVKDYAPKFAMLNAMSYGNTEGKERYIRELQNLIKRHSKTPEEVRAKEILRFLQGDREAFADILFDEDIDKFERADDKLHYVFAVVFGLGQRAFDQAKIDINNYNKKFHRFDNLKTSNIYLNQENKAQIVLIRSFKNKEEAMKYYDGYEKNKSEFIKDEKVAYEVFAATQKNYREVIKQKGVSNYRIFFEDNYFDED